MQGGETRFVRRAMATFAALAIAGFAAQAAMAGPNPDVVIDSEKLGSSNGLSYRGATFPDVGAGGSAFAVAKCPNHKVLTGGGGFVTGLPLNARFLELGPNRIPDFPPKARRSFTAQLQYDGSGTTSFESLAICASERGLSMKTKATPEPDSDALVSAKARCPKGTSVTGGGVTSDSNLENILVSAPYDGGDADSDPDDGWEASLITGLGQDDRRLRAHAFCSDNYKLAYRTDTVTGVTDFGDAKAKCPGGAAITGGGVAISGGAGAFLNRSSPVDGTDVGSVPEDSWLGTAGVTSGSRTVEAFAICRK